MVCLGNICRSPMAEGILRKQVFDLDLQNYVSIDSCGTGAWHVGQAPDSRAQQCMRQKGVDISNIEGRQFYPDHDFEEFDYILTMDDSNYRNVVSKAKGETEKLKVYKVLKFHPDKLEDLSVPDPYYGPGDGFERVYALLNLALKGFVESKLVGNNEA